MLWVMAADCLNILFIDLSLSGDHNSIWFFEKETSKLKNNTPTWEGTIVEFKHTVKVILLMIQIKIFFFHVFCVLACSL